MSLLSVKQLNKLTVDKLLERAAVLAMSGSSRSDWGTVVNLFYEPSTRTRLSFQIAAQNLGLTVLDFAADNSSIQKGESLLDTLQTLDALGVNLVVMRAKSDWPREIEDHNFNFSLVNAGSGIYEHPTQALLDALTIQQHFRTLQNLKVTIVGDVAHSRVARSNAHLLQMMGSEVQFAGPSQYRSEEIDGCRWVDLDQALRNTDVVMMLRIQHERHHTKDDISNYHHQYGLTKERLDVLNPQALIMHPGPVNRGVEICNEALDDGRCRVLQQVQNGVAVRMAVLEWCAKGGHYEQLVSA